MKQLLKRTWAEIDLDALEHNFRILQNRVGSSSGVVGVVKADAYGHGAIEIARRLETLGAKYLAVSNLDEARELRCGGITMPILLLGYTPAENVPQLIENNITQTVTDRFAALTYSNAANRCDGVLKVHIKADTGMSRLGFVCTESNFCKAVDEVVWVCNLPNLEVEGIFTHFALSDETGEESEAYTRYQLMLFKRFVTALEKHGCTFHLCHCANSGAVVNYPDACLDMVRPGILLYGCGSGAKELNLKPVMSLKTTISTIKEIAPGEAIGYGRLYRTNIYSRIGVVPIGYADGLFRRLSGRFSVMTAAGALPQRGRICMDMCMVDLTTAPGLQVGDEVEIFGKNQRADDLAELAETISYELTCAVGKRVPRVYSQDGKIVKTELRMFLQKEESRREEPLIEQSAQLFPVSTLE